MQFFKRTMDRPVGEAKDSDADSAGRRLRLLVVDENQTARTVIARRLSHLNHDVALATTGSSRSISWSRVRSISSLSTWS